MPPEPSDDAADDAAQESRRRLRAMWAYSGMQQGAFLAEIPGAKPNMLRTTKPSRAPDSVLRAAADLVHFPAAFAERGAAGMTDAVPSTPGVDDLAKAILALADGDTDAAIRIARRVIGHTE